MYLKKSKEQKLYCYTLTQKFHIQLSQSVQFCIVYYSILQTIKAPMALHQTGSSLPQLHIRIIWSKLLKTMPDSHSLDNLHNLGTAISKLLERGRGAR